MSADTKLREEELRRSVKDADRFERFTSTRDLAFVLELLDAARRAADSAHDEGINEMEAVLKSEILRWHFVPPAPELSDRVAEIASKLRRAAVVTYKAELKRGVELQPGAGIVVETTWSPGGRATIEAGGFFPLGQRVRVEPEPLEPLSPEQARTRVVVLAVLREKGLLP